MPIAANDRGILCSVRWCIVMHEDDFAAESTVLLFVPWKKVISQKLYMLCRGHFHTFSDPKGAYQLSPHDSCPKHDSSTSWLTSQPCWDIVAIHNHPLLHPSGPSRVARHSSVNKTVWKLVFMYVWAHCNRFCLCALVRSGRIVGLCTTASFWRILHLEVCGTPEAPAASNTGFLLCNGILAAAFLIRPICLAETFLVLSVLWISHKSLHTMITLKFSWII